MNRVFNTKIVVMLAVAVFVIAGGAYYGITKDHKKSAVAGVSTTQTKPAQTDSISYKGKDGQSALALLKQAASVQTKQSSLGEYVVSVNGNDGGGKKYWLFYVNGQESSVGAGTYVTKSTDTIEWRLQ